MNTISYVLYYLRFLPLLLKLFFFEVGFSLSNISFCCTRLAR